jgi:histidine decarboxylase
LRLNAFLSLMEERRDLHAGYPYNLEYDYSPLLPFLEYTLNNLGDPYVDGNYGLHTREFEREVVRWFADLYQLDDEWGYVTSCGTEGNLYGLFLARELLPDARLYFSEDTHYSVLKAARLFRMPYQMIPSRPNGEIEVDALDEAIGRQGGRPAIVNLNIGTTLKGAVDDVQAIVRVLLGRGLDFHLHADAALGGLIVPFTDVRSYLDFTRQPLGSIAVSGHKFIGSPVPCGVVLTRRANVKKVETAVEYIGSVDTTIMGSRNGLAALFLWHALMTREDQLAEEVGECLANARYLRDRLEEIGLRPLLNSNSTTVVFDRPPPEVCTRWQLACSGSLAHVVVMQNLRRSRLDALVSDVLRAKAHG